MTSSLSQGGIRHLAYVFTEQGISIIFILKSDCEETKMISENDNKMDEKNNVQKIHFVNSAKAGLYLKRLVEKGK